MQFVKLPREVFDAMVQQLAALPWAQVAQLMQAVQMKAIHESEPQPDVAPE